MKRTLLDNLRATFGSVKNPGPHHKKILNQIIRAESFSCDDDYTRYAAEASVFQPKKLIALANCARPPRLPVFIEWSSKARREGLLASGQGVTEHLAVDAPERCGFLLSEGDISGSYEVLLLTSEGQFPGGSEMPLLPVGYVIANEGTMPVVKYTKDIDLFRLIDEHLGLANFFLTTRYRQQCTKEDLYTLLHRVTVFWAPGMGISIAQVMAKSEWKEDVVKGALVKFAAEQSGDVRFLYALLGLMNLMKVTVSQPMRAGEGRYLHARNSVPYMPFRTVNLFVPGVHKLKTLKRMIGDAIRHRNHDVNGHFRYYRKSDLDPLCAPIDHEWAPVPGTQRHKCTHCGVQRVWINPHTRGDINLGRV